MMSTLDVEVAVDRILKKEIESRSPLVIWASRCFRRFRVCCLASADVAVSILHSDAAVLSFTTFVFRRHRLHSVVNSDTYQIYTIDNESAIFSL
jgi:hypothetical protein